MKARTLPFPKSLRPLTLLLLLLWPLLLTACGGANDDATPTDPFQVFITPKNGGTAPTLPPTRLPEVTTALAPATPVSGTNTVTSTNTGTAGAAAIPTPEPTPTDSGSAGTPYAASTAGVPPSPTPAGALRQDQTLNMVSGDVATFDPALGADVDTSFVLRQIYSGLVTLDANLNVVPDLAAQMPSVSENSTLYTFKLRQGAKFQSGREITADDFKYSFERATDPKLATPDTPASLPAANYMIDIQGVSDKLAGKATDISGVRVVDKYTLQIKLAAPKPQFLAKLSFNVFFVVNKDAVAKGFDQPDGSGPFKLLDYKANQYIKLARNDLFYFGAPRLAQVNIALGANASNDVVQYEQNRLDLAPVSAGAAADSVLDKSSPLNHELVVKPQLELSYLAFNTRAKPFDDPKIRQAFSIVVDRNRIASAMFENKVVAANGIVPTGMPGYTNPPSPLTYDISRARDLISQSSYHSPENLPRITLYSTGDPLAKVLQDVYKQAFNIDLVVQQSDFNDFQSGLSNQQFQMYLYGWTADYPDPENFLRSLLGGDSAFNDSGYNNPQFDDLLKQGDQQQDPAKRFDLYAQAEQLALTDVPILPIYYDIDYLLVKPYVKGLVLTAAGIWSLRDVYLTS